MQSVDLALLGAEGLDDRHRFEALVDQCRQLAQPGLGLVGRDAALALEHDVLDDEEREEGEGQQTEHGVRGQHPEGRRGQEHDRAHRVRDGGQHLRRRLGIHAGVGDQLPGRVGPVPTVRLGLVVVDDVLPQRPEHTELGAARPGAAHDHAH